MCFGNTGVPWGLMLQHCIDWVLLQIELVSTGVKVVLIATNSSDIRYREAVLLEKVLPVYSINTNNLAVKPNK